jgi:hypothetical protein
MGGSLGLGCLVARINEPAGGAILRSVAARTARVNGE